VKAPGGNVRVAGLKHPAHDNVAASIQLDAVLVLVTLAVWIVIFPRLGFNHDGDRGIYASVGERLLAGDTLYSGVWDNKDPLFFYFVAVQRAFGAWAELAAEVMLVGLCIASAYVIAKMVASRWVAAAIALVAVPIIVTGNFYVSGMTHLPGIALTLAASAAAARGRSGLSGICLAMLFFTKLILMPVAVAAVGCFLLVRRRPKEFMTCILFAGASTLAFVALLAARGELWPFIHAQILNYQYSRGTHVGDKTGLALIITHFERVNIKALGSDLLAIALAIAVACIPVRQLRRGDPMGLAIVGACILTTLAVLFVLAMTGMWLHHNQVMYVPAIFAALALAPILDLAASRARLAAVVALVLAAYFLGGSIWPGQYVRAFQRFPETLASLNELSPETKRLLALAPSGSYARLGSNDDMGHAIGLRGWKLLCARFHLYPIYSADILNPVLECASKAPFLIVANTFTPSNAADANPDWNEFVARSERMLAEEYTCDAKTGLRVCTRLAKDRR